MLRQLKNVLQAGLRRRGIDVRKVPAQFAPIPVFRLAVEALMARQGDALSFVQVGANDGMFGDPLRGYVLSRGWRGVLVEPQPRVFEKLKANYAACSNRLIFENLAISDQATLTLYLPPLELDGCDKVYAESIVSSDARVISRQIGMGERQLQKVVVPAMTLDQLFAKHRITDLDVLQIDAEGYDWQVLQTLDLGRVRPRLIQMETGHLSRRALADMAHHLNGAGYLLYYGGWQGDAVAMAQDFFAE